MQPLQSFPSVENPLVSTHIATEDDNNDAAIPLRSATTDSKPPYYYAHTTHPKQLEATVALRHVEIQESSDASRPQRYHLSSSFLSTSPSAAVKSHARGAVSISWAGSSRTTNRARVCHPWTLDYPNPGWDMLRILTNRSWHWSLRKKHFWPRSDQQWSPSSL